MNYLINKLGLGHTIAVCLIAVMLIIVTAIKINMVKRINYAIDYELGIAHNCNGTDTAYEVYGCKYDYSEWLK